MNTTTLETIALSAPEAAKTLGISARTLWQLTKDKKIPHLRLGSRVTYPVDMLKTWANEQAQKAVQAQENA